MGKDSKIEWTDHTFNPWWGCVRVSPGCQHCYAESFAKRVGQKVWGVEAPRRMFGDAHWDEPLKWDAAAAAEGVRRRVFCASMADVFEDRPELVAPRERLFALIERTPHLDWLLLTKRPENMRRLAARWSLGWPSNAWAGCTVESQAQARRILWLVEVPAAVRFLSCEPLLSALDLTRVVIHPSTHPHEPEVSLNALTGLIAGPDERSDMRIHWVIAGGESGHGARPMHPAWALSLRDQCATTGVAFLFKQWGEWSPDAFEGADQIVEAGTEADPHVMVRVGKHVSGRQLDGVTHDALPEARC